jgi:hypothetical protein
MNKQLCDRGYNMNHPLTMTKEIPRTFFRTMEDMDRLEGKNITPSFLSVEDQQALLKVFENDIQENLEAWASFHQKVYYRTKRYNYCYYILERHNVLCAIREDLNTRKTLCIWVNPKNCVVGKEFVLDHPDIKIGMFEEVYTAQNI